MDYSSISALKTWYAIRLFLGSSCQTLSDEEVETIVLEKQKLVRQMINQGLRLLPRFVMFLRCAMSCYQLAIAIGFLGTSCVVLKNQAILAGVRPFSLLRRCVKR